MKVILMQDVKGLGQKGEVKTVSDGYARNYLLPKGMAEKANAESLDKLRKKKAAENKRKHRELTASRQLKEQIENLYIKISANAGESGRLFGSITNKDIAEHLVRQGVKVDRRKINLAEPLRQLGVHRVSLRLHPQVEAELEVEIISD